MVSSCLPFYIFKSILSGRMEDNRKLFLRPVVAAKKVNNFDAISILPGRGEADSGIFLEVEVQNRRDELSLSVATRLPNTDLPPRVPHWPMIFR